MYIYIGNLKKVLKGRGDNGYTSMQRMFEDMDKDGDHSLSVTELKNAMKNLNIIVTEPELRR
jgi:Ca2+-binding EF-hand superfamily protein